MPALDPGPRRGRGVLVDPRYFDRQELHGALAAADAVVLTMPLTPETEHILDAGAIAAFKPTAYVVNMARGGLIDEATLIAALREGRLAGAGVDVATVEPPPPDSPLWHMPNVILTPHQAPLTDRLADHLVAFWAENIRRFADGAPLQGLVDRQAGY